MTKLIKSGGLVFLALVAATASQAAPQATASSTATIFKPITTTAPAQQMSFGKLQYNAGGGPASSAVVLSSQPPTARTSPYVQLLPNGGETPAIRTITGQPNALYRVTTPTSATASGNLTVDGFTIWSANSGNISASHQGQLNSQGTDTIRVGGTLQVPVKTKNGTFTANPAILISYE